MRRTQGLAFTLPLLTVLVFAQAPAPTFDVASVKTNKSADTRTDGQLAGNRFSMTNETLWRLIGEAYAEPQALPRSRIVGGPAWIDTDRFDVAGVAASSLTRQDAALMLRTLLADRFKLTVHLESRDQPIFALTLARNDGRFGPALKRSAVDCASPPPQIANQPRPCVMYSGFGRLSASGMTLTQLATMGLSRIARRNVVDHTGLTGAFDWNLLWTPDNLPVRAAGTPADQPLVVNGIVVDPNGPSLFTALKEQLGLKLEPATGPVDVVVIDHVEHPTEN